MAGIGLGSPPFGSPPPSGGLDEYVAAMQRLHGGQPPPAPQGPYAGPTDPRMVARLRLLLAYLMRSGGTEPGDVGATR